jgi:soluble lytic murein transglycosylase-like protein
MTLVLLLQAHLDLDDEKPALRLRRIPGTRASGGSPRGGISAGAGVTARPQVTQRVLLCAPATFKGRRTGAIPAPSNERILFVAPHGWAARRHAQIGIDHLTRSPSAGRPLRMHSIAYTTTLPSVASDMSTVLLAAKRHAKAYRQPATYGLAIAAGTAVVAMVTYHWHSSSLPPVLTAMKIDPPKLTTTLDPLPMISAPHLVAQLSRRAPSANIALPALSMDDVQRLLVSAPAHIGSGEGFNLDITSAASLWAKAGARYRIDPLLIYAVALVETKSAQPDGSIAPSPWVVRINGRLHKGSRADSEHAIQLAHLMALPVQDVGIMQVYYPMHRDVEPDPIALLNPARNIEVGTSLLRKAMEESRDPVLRIGYYHSHDAELARGYGQTVLSVYRELKTAMGRSTSSAVALARAPSDAISVHGGG